MIEPDLARGFVEELSRAAAEPRLPATVPPNAAPFDVVLHALHVACGAMAIGLVEVRFAEPEQMIDLG